MFFLAHLRTDYWRSTAARDVGARTVTLTFCKLVLILCWRNASTVIGVFEHSDDGFCRDCADLAFHLTHGEARQQVRYERVPITLTNFLRTKAHMLSLAAL